MHDSSSSHTEKTPVMPTLSADLRRSCDCRGLLAIAQEGAPPSQADPGSVLAPELRRTNLTLRQTSGVSRAASISLGGNVDKKEECNGHKRPLCLHGAKSMSGFSDPGQLPALCSPLALGQSSNKPRVLARGRLSVTCVY